MVDSGGSIVSPGALGGLQLRNRMIKAATFEGMTPNGTPGDRYRAFHGAIARGGVAMTTLAYCAAEPDGRLHANVMSMGEPVRAALGGVVREVRDAGAYVSGQLVHCGGFTKNGGLRGRALAPSAGVNLLGAAYGMPFTRAMNERDMDAFVDAFAGAAAFMRSVGFDCIELHFGHGYGLCQFMSPKTNRRRDAYGGSLENRMRLPLRVLEAVRGAVGGSFPIVGKLSLTEGVRGGIEPGEAIEMGRILDGAGIDALVTSGGSSTFNPMLMFRGEDMSREMLKHERNLLVRLGIRLMRRRMFGDYPFSENYFRDSALRLREAVRCKVIYVGGASSRESLDALMRDGFDFVQLGRALLADPAFPRRIAEPGYVNPCTHCNQCIAYIEHPEGIRCVL